MRKFTAGWDPARVRQGNSGHHGGGNRFDTRRVSLD